MDDLISRQAAITLPIMPKEYRKHKPIDCDDAYEQGWGDCQSCIGRLPTAEPEIIRCKDCKWFGKIGCAIGVVDDTDKPTENDYCSFAERRSDD